MTAHPSIFNCERFCAIILAIGSASSYVAAFGADDLPARAERLKINACALLLPSEIFAVIGLPVTEGRREDSGFESNGSYSSACVWTIKRNAVTVENPLAPLGGQSFVILNAMQWPIGSNLAGSFIDAFRTAASKGEIPGKPVPRQFGDEALWWGDGLAVRKGDVSFGISVFIPDLANNSSGAFEAQLAPMILQRLPRSRSVN